MSYIVGLIFLAQREEDLRVPLIYARASSSVANRLQHDSSGQTHMIHLWNWR